MSQPIEVVVANMPSNYKSPASYAAEREMYFQDMLDKFALAYLSAAEPHEFDLPHVLMERAYCFARSALNARAEINNFEKSHP